MAAPMDEHAYSELAQHAAAERYRKRRDYHARVAEARATGKYEMVNQKARLDRRKLRVTSKNTKLREGTQGGRGFEQVLNFSRDFQFTTFLEQAIHVAQAVCRLVTRKEAGVVRYGTGFLVTPQLLLTNHHVLPSRKEASATRAEFGYQLDRDGNPHPRIRRIELDPDRFFFSSKRLDFALVALQLESQLDRLPAVWCPMIKELGKIVILEHVNIIQHPLGREKQVVIRENRVIDSFDWKGTVLHYEADTERGSSGSPVFNDQWEVVAVHHASVPNTDSRGRWLKVDGGIWKKETDDPILVHWVANEGVRTSKIVQEVERLKVDGEAKRLWSEFLEAKAPTLSPSVWNNDAVPDPQFAFSQHSGTQVPLATTAGLADVPGISSGRSGSSLSIPIRISVEIGSPEGGAATIRGGVVTPAVGDAQEDRSKKWIGRVEDADSAGESESMERSGYDPMFLGMEVPFPLLTVATRSKAFAFQEIVGNAKYLIPYHHFSILFHKTRRVAFVAGVNYDPTAPVRLLRDEGREDWRYDRRLKPAEELQAGEFLYDDNPLDKGHLVRRTDAAWGATPQEARSAGDDTFFFTNCVPQHEITNRGQTQKAPDGLVLWRQIEDFLTKRGDESQRRISIFNGPILRDHDLIYKKVKLPREFWKVVVFRDDSGNPKSLALRLTQASLIQGLEEAFLPSEYETVQVSIKSIEADTGLNFGKIAAWDTLEQEKALEHLAMGTSVVRIRDLSQIVL